LKEQVVKQRKLKKIEELKKEIAGESPAENYKRNASFSSSSLSEKSRKLIRSKISPIFSEKSIRKLYEYETAWKIYFEITDEIANLKKIKLVATFLRENAQDT
jgi:hypothetical protein